MFETPDGRALREGRAWLVAQGCEEVRTQKYDGGDSAVEFVKSQVVIRIWSEKGIWYVGAQPLDTDLRYPLLDDWGRCLGFESGLFDKAESLSPMNSSYLAAIPYLQPQIEVLRLNLNRIVEACEPDTASSTVACLSAASAAYRETILQELREARR